MAILGVTHDTAIYPLAGSYTSGILSQAPADKVAFTPSIPARIVRWGMICDVAYTVTPPKWTLDFRPTAGSNASRVTGLVTAGVDAAGGTLTSPTIGQAGTLAGQGIFHNVFQGVQAVSGLDGFIIFPGQQAVIALVTASTAGSAFAFIEYENLTFQGDAATPGVGTQTTTINPIVNMTKVAS